MPRGATGGRRRAAKGGTTLIWYLSPIYIALHKIFASQKQCLQNMPRGTVTWMSDSGDWAKADTTDMLLGPNQRLLVAVKNCNCGYDYKKRNTKYNHQPDLEQLGSHEHHNPLPFTGCLIHVEITLHSNSIFRIRSHLDQNQLEKLLDLSKNSPPLGMPPASTPLREHGEVTAELPALQRRATSQLLPPSPEKPPMICISFISLIWSLLGWKLPVQGKQWKATYPKQEGRKSRPVDVYHLILIAVSSQTGKYRCRPDVPMVVDHAHMNYSAEHSSNVHHLSHRFLWNSVVFLLLSHGVYPVEMVQWRAAVKSDVEKGGRPCINLQFQSGTTHQSSLIGVFKPKTWVIGKADMGAQTTSKLVHTEGLLWVIKPSKDIEWAFLRGALNVQV
ncbi:hypothetical protein B0H17DRAFT_1128573 [Mycena rosella]|uniref:Uncharacterized protein n=1 Tax=Mycena rosella TaxID=1033263 RepID=A0AAD7DW91_MYCRO|nr:hypothetical protein B0H17DRAFT_1128573 [Mycena rosella]